MSYRMKEKIKCDIAYLAIDGVLQVIERPVFIGKGLMTNEQWNMYQKYLPIFLYADGTTITRCFKQPDRNLFINNEILKL